MPRPVGLVQLQFRPGSDFMNPDSPVGSCFHQFLLNITETPPFAIRSFGGDMLFAGPHLDDTDKAVVMICYDTASESDARSALHPTSPIYAPLRPHLQSAPCTDVFLFVRPPAPNYGQYRERVQELAILRFPARHFDDIDDEIADDSSPFAAGLWHLEDFFNDAQCSNAHHGPADLARHYQGISSGDPERQGTSVLHAWSWASEAAMVRFKDPTQPNYYDHIDRSRREAGQPGEPYDLWQTGFLKEIEDLRANGAEVSGMVVMLQSFALITKKLHYIDETFGGE